MPVYFAIQTINDKLRTGKLENALGSVSGDAFLIKVGASHTEEKVKGRETTYRSHQDNENEAVTFIPNLGLPFAAAKWIQDGTFELLEGDKLGRVKGLGTDETYIVQGDIDVRGLRNKLKVELEAWREVSHEEWKEVCKYLESLLKVFVAYKLTDEGTVTKCVEELVKSQHKFEAVTNTKQAGTQPEGGEDEPLWK
ncbi:hypothetical protein FRC12_012783 [Ceratobasidium sp. 428]|nr:hypothetical protein FRC12_012783 [Ceratobasidium sp. 428]